MHALAHRLIGIASTLAALSSAAQLSPAWQSYAANPDAHPTIPSVAYAGYNSGTAPLPTTTDGRGIVQVSSFGAVADDASDDTNAIRTAIDVARGIALTNPNGVAVVFSPGEYIVSGPLFVHSSNTILAGAGTDQTSLRFTTSLRDSYAEYPFWGFSGGMVWFIDESRQTYMAGVPSISSLDVFWSTSSPSTNLAAGAALGDRSVTVNSASQFSPGDYVFLQIDNADDLSTLRHLFGDGTWANNYPFSPAIDGAILPDNRSTFRSMHRIESIAGNTVTFEEPLKLDARSEWSPQLRTPARVIHDVGIRDMTLRFDRPYTWTNADHNNEPGYNGVCMNAVINGFIENVDFRNTDGLAVNINGGKHITVRNVNIGADTEALLACHHAFFVANSFDVLVQDFQIDSIPRHGLYYGSTTMGSVYSRGTAAGGTFDYHRILPYANAITEVQIVNTGRAGGDSDSGPPMGARHTHWNVDTLGTGGRFIAQPDIMPRGSVVGVRCAPVAQPSNDIAGDPEALVELSGQLGTAPIPANLHDAQLALRLGLPIDTTQTGTPCDTCGPDQTYTFPASATIGQDLQGQDAWILDRDFTAAGAVATMSIDSSFPEGPVVTPIGVQGREGIYTRQSNADFGFTPPAHDATSAEIRFSLRSGGSTGSGDALLITNNAYDEGVQFGMSNNSTITLRGGRFSQTLFTTVSLPGGWYSRGEWAELRLTIDLTANAGDGSGTVAFRNLSRSEATFRDIPGLIGVSLQGVVRYPETWDRIEFRMDDEAALTNIAVNIDPSDDTACCTPDIAAPFGTVDYLDAVRFYQAYDDSEPLADWNNDGSFNTADVQAYMADFQTPCP